MEGSSENATGTMPSPKISTTSTMQQIPTTSPQSSSGGKMVGTTTTGATGTNYHRKYLHLLTTSTSTSTNYIYLAYHRSRKNTSDNRSPVDPSWDRTWNQYPSINSICHQIEHHLATRDRVLQIAARNSVSNNLHSLHEWIDGDNTPYLDENAVYYSNLVINLDK